MRGRPQLVPISLALLALAGCEDKPRPWSRGDGPPVVLARPPVADGAAGAPGDTGSGEAAATPPASATGTEQPAGTGTAASGPVQAPAAAPQAAAEELPGTRVTPGGPWVKCLEGLPLSGDPLKDVTRLGILCGPANGMRRKTRHALVGLVGEREPPVAVTLRAARGACYRIFAAADENVSELDVTVRSSHDVRVAADHGKGRLAIVQPDRPFCTFADETFTVEVSAGRGGGRFAAEVWALGEPRKKQDPMESPADEPPLDKP